MTAGEVSAGRLERSPSASWSPRWRTMSTAASLFVFAAFVAGQDDRRPGLGQRTLDPRILLLGECGLERRQRVRRPAI